MHDWYRKSFGTDYLIVYRHRDFKGAYEEVRQMIGWLGLDSGASVLDLCCGTGRHALALADFGYRVTGVDLSEVLLEEARKNDTDQRIKWVHGDMRNVPLDTKFDAVVNLFTSFGYFENDAENEQVLSEISRLLKDEGRFIIDYLNPTYVTKNLVPYSEREVDGMTIEERRKIEDGCVQKTIRIREAGKPERTYIEKVKLYDLDTFVKMAERHKLLIQNVYGNYDQSQYDSMTSPRMIMVGEKKGA